MSASTRRALPQSYTRASDSTLDALTDPGNSVNSGNQGDSGTDDNVVAPVTVVTQGNSVAAGNPGNNVAKVNSVNSKQPAERREHIKARESLVMELRNAVWFLTEHGRPRVTLAAITDEAIEQWLNTMKEQHNGGEDFPHRGSLR